MKCADFTSITHNQDWTTDGEITSAEVSKQYFSTNLQGKTPPKHVSKPKPFHTHILLLSEEVLQVLKQHHELQSLLTL